MDRLRRLALVVAPLPIVITSLGLSWGLKSRPTTIAGNVAFAPRAAVGASLDRSSAEAAADDREHELSELCEGVGRRLRDRLAAHEVAAKCHVIVRSPFIVAGDLPAHELAEWSDRTIEPAARAMARAYFRRAPTAPITILLFDGESSYDHFARALFAEEGVSVYGYYKRDERTLVMNIATGGGTLVHELTHALADFDFPNMPDWFNEGLASLHEQCRIRRDGSGIDGLENWRLAGLQETIRQGRLRSLHNLMSASDFRGREIGLNYAHARYLCMYLQRVGLLERFYADFRSSHPTDPHGLDALMNLFPGTAWDELDRNFSAWVLALPLP